MVEAEGEFERKKILPLAIAQGGRTDRRLLGYGEFVKKSQML